MSRRDLVRFVVLAAPRTGSNWLCTLLDSHPDILCHHEIFNPEGLHYSLSYRQDELDLGTKEQRDKDPWRVLGGLWQETFGHPAVGFKWSRGQDARVLNSVLEDREIRKIVVRRNNRIKTFVSETIARKTGEWESYPGRKISQQGRQIEVGEKALRQHIALNRRLYAAIDEALASSGQSALTVTYEKLASDVERLRATDFLGVSPQAESLKEATRKQNPKDLRQLVANFEQLASDLRGTDLEAELHDRGI
ncbi:MAG: hypothetical protein AAF657_24010 [Acidobacteriota bacterium]